MVSGNDFGCGVLKLVFAFAGLHLPRGYGHNRSV